MTTTKHFIERSKERHGLVLDEKVAQGVIDDIHNCKAIYISRGTTGATCIYAVLIGKDLVPVVYSKTTKKLVTTLHKSALFSKLKKRLFELKEEA